MRLIWCLALLPGIVVAIVVLLQATTLTTPSVPATPPNGCVPALYPPLGNTPAPTTAQCGPRHVAEFHAAIARMSTNQDDALLYGWAGVAALFGLGIAAALAARASRRRRPSHASAAPATSRASATSRAPAISGASATLAAAERERKVLVDACIHVSDRLSNAALRDELLDALERAGVTPVDVAPGQRFDASRHHAADRVMTVDARQDNLVFKTERAGFVDHGERVRYPEVLVYKAERG